MYAVAGPGKLVRSFNERRWGVRKNLNDLTPYVHWRVFNWDRVLVSVRWNICHGPSASIPENFKFAHIIWNMKFSEKSDRYRLNGSLLRSRSGRSHATLPVPKPSLWGGALRDDPKNGCEGDYLNGGIGVVLYLVLLVFHSTCSLYSPSYTPSASCL